MTEQSQSDKDEPVKVCVFDNPATFAREAWEDGKLLCKVDAAVLLGKDFRGGRWFPFMLNCGPWNEGAHYGDPKAIALPECGTRFGDTDAEDQQARFLRDEFGTTPRTEAAMQSFHSTRLADSPRPPSGWEFARQLERELAEVKDELARHIVAHGTDTTPVSARSERITEVVGADGKGVAAPCAIDGCALMKGDYVRSTSGHWVFAAAEKHRKLVLGMGIVYGHTGSMHLLEMLDKIKAGMSPTKACRWLGWIQASINAAGAATLDELKAINKAASDAFVSASGERKA